MPVTFEEMTQAREEYNKARVEFTQKYLNFLNTVLKEVGFYKKLVKIKDRNLVGEFKVGEERSVIRPFEIKFYPLTQSGNISLKSKYIYLESWNESSLVETLRKVAEVVGDLP